MPIYVGILCRSLVSVSVPIYVAYIARLLTVQGRPLGIVYWRCQQNLTPPWYASIQHGFVIDSLSVHSGNSGARTVASCEELPHIEPLGCLRKGVSVKLPLNTPGSEHARQKGKWNHIKQFNSLTVPQVYTLGTNASESLQFYAGPFQAPAGVRTRDSPQMKGILPLDHW